MRPPGTCLNETLRAEAFIGEPPGRRGASADSPIRKPQASRALPGRRRAGRGIMSQSSAELGPKSHHLFVKTDKRGGGSTQKHRIRAVEPAGGELEGNTLQDS